MRKRYRVLQRYLVEELSMLQLNGKNGKACATCLNTGWTGNLMAYYSRGRKVGKEKISLRLHEEKTLASELSEDKTTDASALLPPGSEGKKVAQIRLLPR